MQETHCPFCYGALETRDVGPCDECGGSSLELEHFRQGIHTYAEYEVFPPLRLTLCNFCSVDFGSFDPAYFGLPPRTRIGYEKMRALEPVGAPAAGRDKFCPTCGHRLRFLRFVAKARRQNASNNRRS
jgi:hypothetical protein